MEYYLSLYLSFSMKRVSIGVAWLPEYICKWSKQGVWEIIYIALKEREECMQILHYLDMKNKELMKMMDKDEVGEFGIDSRFLNMLINSDFGFWVIQMIMYIQKLN